MAAHTYPRVWCSFHFICALQLRAIPAMVVKVIAGLDSALNPMP